MDLESVVKIAPHLPLWFDQDTSIYVSDIEKILVAVNHPNVNLGVYEGQPLDTLKRTLTYKALQSKRRAVAYVDKNSSQFGMPYVAIANPIEEDNRVVGVMSVVMSTENVDALITIGAEIMATLEEIYASSENLSAQSQEFSATIKHMDGETIHVKNDLALVGNITSEIKKISTQSNILGINASIESARAGEHGRGFAVVANEVRKLADNTNLSVNNIEDNVRKVQESVGVLVDSINQLTAVSESQTLGVMELTKALGQIATMAEKLVKMGQKLQSN